MSRTDTTLAEVPTDAGHPLDNPNRHALTGVLSRFAEGAGLARRFRRDTRPDR